MKKKLRVLFAIGSLGGGGAERVLLDQLARLDRERFTPLLYLVSRSGALLAELPADVPVFAFYERHTTSRWNWPGRIHRQQVHDLATVIREQQIDLVFDHTFHMTLITGPATRLTAVPRISLVVCDPVNDLVQSEKRFLFFKKRLLRQAYQSAAAVVAVSEGVRLALLDFYDLEPALVQTLYNPINLERIDRLCAEEMLPLAADCFHIVCCGRLHPQKGFACLIEAARTLVQERGMDQLRFHILGEGPARAELTEQIEQGGLTETVQLVGFQENPFPYYRQAQLFCLSSLYEGFGLVLAEAMACRIPVLATDCPSGPAEILAGGEFGHLIPPGDATSLADGISDAVAQYPDWQALVPAARKRVEDLFGYETVMQQLEALFEQALGQ